MPRIATTLGLAALIVVVSAGCGSSPAAPTPGSTTTGNGSGALGDAATSTPTATTGPTAGSTGTAAATDPWLMTTDGIGPYRLGQRIDTMPAGAFGSSTAIDSANCPDLYDRAATGMYAGVLLLVVRHSVLVQIFSGGGDPGVHSAQNDKVGDAWATIESRHPTGAYKMSPSGSRAFVVPVGDRVMLFNTNPIRPDSVGGYTVGLADHSQATFLSGKKC